jgi:CHAT domain-containing protein/tetratricopeptide (TPR) repeat protein
MNIKLQSSAGYSAIDFWLKMLFFALICIFFLVGCVTPANKGGPKTVSLKEAKKITATFERQTFTPPPRTIRDVTAILAQEKPDDLKSYQKALALADRKAPATKNASRLAQFYFKRGMAAGEVGRARQNLADLRLAVKYGTQSNSQNLQRIMFRLGTVEQISGNFSKGVQLMENAIAKEGGPAGRSIYSAILAESYAYIGDVAAANEALARAKKLRGQSIARYKLRLKTISEMNSYISLAQGAILGATGRLAEAEVHHRRAVKYMGGSKEKKRISDYNWMVAELADNLRRQGRLIEAEVEARRALQSSLQSHGRYYVETGTIIRKLTKVIFEQGRYAEAEALARANLDIYQQIGTAADSAILAMVRSMLAEALLTQMRWDEALVEYDAIRTVLKTDQASYEKLIAVNVNLWLALIKRGRIHESLALIQPALERKKALFGEEHYDTAEIQGVFAIALAAKGEKEMALNQFAMAVPILLQRSNRSEGGGNTKTARDFRLGLILDAFIQLLAKVQGATLETKAGIDAAAEAFRLADVARGRTVKQALAASSARAAAKDPDLADLARREQDALTQIGALNGLLSNVLSAPSDQQNPKAIKDLRLRIDRLRSARAALIKEIEARFPNYANLIDPKPSSIEEAQSNLMPGEALVATYVGESGSYVWAIPHQGPAAFASSGLDAKRIVQMVKTLRTALDPTADTLGDIPDLDLEIAYRLYEALLKPVETGWKDAKNLIVIAHGALGFLPFSVLPTKAVKLDPEKKPLFSNYRAIPYLARSHAVTVLPSVVSLRALRNLPPATTDRQPFTGFGDPYFSVAQVPRKEAKAQVASDALTRGLPLKRRAFKVVSAQQNSATIAILPPLPDTAVELREIALALKADPERDVFLAKAASEDRVKSMDLSDVKVLAFATHGLLPGDLDGLSQMALALSSPDVTGGTEDGLLTMGEILGLKLNADWVVLSACNTGAGEGAGAEAVSGLGRAFFYAGTRALLVSNWPVETTSAKTLTTHLFRQQAADPNLSRSEALNRTMLDLIDRLGYMEEGKMVFSYAHPVFWAPFSLVGDGG